MDVTTGGQLCSFRAEGPVRAQPAVFDGVVYLASDDGHVYALE